MRDGPGATGAPSLLAEHLLHDQRGGHADTKGHELPNDFHNALLLKKSRYAGLEKTGGGGGSRTPNTLAGMTNFKSAGPASAQRLQILRGFLYLAGKFDRSLLRFLGLGLGAQRFDTGMELTARFHSPRC